MPSLRLRLESQVVDLAVRWIQEEKLRSFKLRGWNDLAADLLAEDVLKKQELRLSDFQDPERDVSVDFSETLSAACLSDLFQALKQEKHLAELCLLDLGDKAMPALCRSAQTLRSLQLSGCGLTDAAGEPLGQLLQVSESLCKLSLSNNRLSCEAAACLSAGLRCNDFLCELNLRLNAIADKGCCSLAEALEVNPYVLETLDVSENDFEEVGQKMLEAAFGQSCSMARIRLGGGGAPCVLEKSPTAAVGLEGAPPLPRAERRGFGFVVHCHSSGAEICAEEARPISHPGKLVDMQQDDKELDLVFSIPRLDPDVKAAVSLSATALKITALQQTLVDLQLFSCIDPASFELSSRDFILELTLVKAKQGELWPRLEK
ncbi:LRRC74A [Symbiodinium microadriaticum]|nr:LRRC74A [Symbiodinium microadriaticum]